MFLKRRQGTFNLRRKMHSFPISFVTAAENRIQIQPLSIKVPSFTHQHSCNFIFQSLKMALSKKQVGATVTKKMNFYNDSNIKKKKKETKDESINSKVWR